MHKRVSNLLFSIGVIAAVVAIAFVLLLVRTTIEAHAENNSQVVTETEVDSASTDEVTISGDTVIIEDEEVALAASPEDKIANLYWIWFVIAVVIAGFGAFFGIIMQRRKERMEI